MKTCLDCPHWALAFVAGGEPHGVCEVVPGAPEAGPSVPISDCPVLLLMERMVDWIEELEAELGRVAPFKHWVVGSFEAPPPDWEAMKRSLNNKGLLPSGWVVTEVSPGCVKLEKKP